MPLPIRDLPERRDVTRLAVDGDDSAAVAVLTLFVVSRDLYASYERFFAAHGISDGKWSILMLLETAPDRALAPSTLAARLAVTRATVTGLVKGLERDGFVTRRDDPDDGRRDRLSITAKGTRLLERLLPALAQRHAAAAAALTRAERRTLVALLERLALPAAPEPKRARRSRQP